MSTPTDACGDIVVAIDGPSGSGKSSVVARRGRAPSAWATSTPARCTAPLTWWCLHEGVRRSTTRRRSPRRCATLPLDVGTDPDDPRSGSAASTSPQAIRETAHLGGRSARSRPTSTCAPSCGCASARSSPRRSRGGAARGRGPRHHHRRRAGRRRAGPAHRERGGPAGAARAGDARRRRRGRRSRPPATRSSAATRDDSTVVAVPRRGRRRRHRRLLALDLHEAIAAVLAVVREHAPA